MWWRQFIYKLPIMDIENAAKQLEALGNVTRLEIFRTLIQAGQSGMTVGDIQKKLGIPASTLSHHISKLMQCALLSQQRESRNLYCKANFANMTELMSFLMRNCCAADEQSKSCL